MFLWIMDSLSSTISRLPGELVHLCNDRDTYESLGDLSDFRKNHRHALLGSLSMAMQTVYELSRSPLRSMLSLVLVLVTHCLSSW